MVNTNTNTILNMPIPGSRLAPEKYRGDYSRIRAFINHYEIICDYNNVLTGTAKCETIIRYCSNKVRQVILGLPSYTRKDWVALKADLLQLFDAERDTKRYRVRDLIKFVKTSKNRSIRDLTKWKKYVRNFIMIAGWLLEQKKLSDAAHDTYFWTGIPRVLRNRLEGRILAKDPTRDLAEPFTFRETSASAEALFQRDRFDMNMIDSDDDADYNSPAEDSDESRDNSESDSDDDEDHRYDKPYKTHKHRSHKKSHRNREESDDEEFRKVHAPRTENRKGKNTGKIDEVESLIKEMNGLHVGDPQYGLVYWKAIKMDSDVRLIVPEPQLRQSVPPPRISNIDRHLEGSSRPIPTFRAQQFQRQGPPHLSSTFQASQPPPNPTRAPVSQLQCYGCRAPGHTINQCPRINEFIQTNVLIRQANGRLARPDGSWVSRQPNETLVEAVEREQQISIQSNFISVSNESSDDETYDWMTDYQEDQGYESEDEAETYLAVPHIVQLDENGYPVNGIEVYPVERQVKSTTTARREVMDGVVIPTRQRMPNKNVPKPMARMGATTRSQTAPQSPPVHIKPPPAPRPQPPPPAPRPVRVPITRPVKSMPRAEPSYSRDRLQGNKENFQEPFDVEDSRKQSQKDKRDEVIEDVELKQGRPNQVPERLQQVTGQNVNPFTNKVLVPHRQSAVSSQVAPIEILKRILGSPITVAIGDILGVSKEVTGLLTDSLRTKAPKTITPGPAVVATAYRTDTRGFLIKLQMDCNDRPITAIIDTGSQLNIVSHKACNRAIKRPIDLRSKVMMNDANGTSRALTGLVENVPLHCGGLQTTASLHVGNHVPFDLLLGRPWQRGNYVSIDERAEGTYLLFRDPDDFEGRYEILVQPDDEPHQFPFDPSLYAHYDSEEEYSECFSVSISGDELAKSGNTQTCRLPSPTVERTLSEASAPGFPQTRSGPEINSVNPSDFEIDQDLLFSLINQDIRTELLTALGLNDEKEFKHTSPSENLQTIKSERPEDQKLFLLEDSQPNVQLNKPNPYIDMPYQATGTPSAVTVPATPNLSNIPGAPDSASPRIHLDNQRTAPEMLLLGLGDIGHLQRTGQSQPLIIRTHHAVHLGTTRDPLGFQPQRILALQCAMLPDPESETGARITQYGSAEIYFYEGIGNRPPPGEGFPEFPTTREGVSSMECDILSTSLTESSTRQPPQIIPAQYNGETIGHTSHGPGRTSTGGTHSLAAPPSYPGANQPLPRTPITSPPTVVTRPLPSNIVPPPLDILRQLLESQPSLSHEFPDFEAPVPLRPAARSRQHGRPFLALLPSPTTPSPTLSNDTNTSPSVNSPDSMPGLISVSDSDSDSSVNDDANLLYPGEQDYDSEEEMDWEEPEEIMDALEEGEIDELLDDSDDDRISEITKSDISSARLLMRSTLDRKHRLYDANVLPLLRDDPNSITPVKAAFNPPHMPSPHRPLFNHASAIDLQSLEEAAMDTSEPFPEPLPVHHYPITRSKSKFAKQPSVFPSTPLPPTINFLDRVVTPGRPRSPLKVIRPSNDIQVYCVTIPTEPSHSKLLAEALQRRKDRLAKERLESQTLQDSNETVPDSDPPRSPSYEPAQTPLSPTSTSPTNSSPITTRPNTPEEPITPRTRNGNGQRGRNLKRSTRRLRSDTHQNRASAQWTRPTGLAETSAFPTITIQSSTQAPSLTVRPSDTVINHDPPIHAHPSPIINVYADDNVRLSVPMEIDDDESQPALLRHGTTSPPVTVPPFPTTDDLSRPPASLPLSHLFRRPNDVPVPGGDERDIPIEKRPYHGFSDFEFARPMARIKGYFNVDTRTLQILTSTSGIQNYYIKRFTILGGILEPFVLPFRIDNTPSGTADIPPYSAYNWLSRLAELHNLRHSVRHLVDDVTKCLTFEQHKECNRPTISVFRLRDGRLIPTETNRGAFLCRLHPSFNPAITNTEANFLRSAIYILRETPAYTALADATDLLLRTGHYDTWLITELVAMDCLGEPTKDARSLAFITAVENERISDYYEEVRVHKLVKERTEALQRATTARQGPKRRRVNEESSSSGSSSD